MFPKSEGAVEYRDSLRSTVDAPDVILELPVRLEVKKEKHENRLLVLTQYRLYILTSSKPPSKVESSYNILDISSIESATRSTLKFTVLPDSKAFSFMTPHPSNSNDSLSPVHNTAYDFDSFLSAFVYAFRLSFPESSRRPLPPIITNPQSRIEAITAAFGCVSSPNAAATFSAAYRCACDRLSAEYKPFVAWDVDTIFWMHEDREMALSDFEQGPVDTLTPKDYLPLFAALQYDTWFTSLNLSQSKLTPEIVTELCNVLATNRSLTDLRMANVTGRSMNEILTKIQQTLERCHGGSSLSLLDFSGNSFDDKAVAALCTITGCLASRLSFLSLARCSLSSRQICQLADAPGLRGAAMAGNLSHLDLTASSCKSDEASQSLCNLISSASTLRHLNLSSTEINLQHLGNALIVSSPASLNFLDLSQNSSAFRAHLNVSGSQLIKYFQVTSGLRKLLLAENKLPPDLLRQVMASLATNIVVSDLDVDLSGNELQKTGAVAVVVEVLPLCSCISAINFSDNGLDNDFGKLVEAASRASAMQRLNFAKNTPSAKSRLPVAETFANFLQTPESRLKSLDVSDCKLRQAASTLCAALTDSRLTEIDLSGNLMTDSGVVYLAKALQGNTRLRRVNIDRNQVTLTGFQVLLTALSKNFTLTSLPTPLSDVALVIAAKASFAEKCGQIFSKIEMLLSRNRENCATGGGHTVAKQVFRFQTGCGISENLETLWQMYGEIEHLYLSVQPPGGMMPSAVEEPVLAETCSTLSLVREILKKLSNMSYPMPNMTASEKIFGDSLESVAKQSFQPVVENLVHAVEMLANKGHSILPMSASGVRQILDQTVQGCSAECHRETSRALVSACYVCHYASLFRVLEAITNAVRDRLRECRLALVERATKGRAKPVLSASLSSPGSSCQASKYGTLHRRQRPVSAMTPEVFPAFSDDTPEETQLNHLYAHVASSTKTPTTRRPTAAEVFDTTPPPPAALQMPVTPNHETSTSPAALLANPCKERPKKPKNQRPTRPVVVSRNPSDVEASLTATLEVPQPETSNRAKPGAPSPTPLAHNHSPAHVGSMTSTLPIAAAISHVSNDRPDSNSGDELPPKDSAPSSVVKTSLNKAVIGGVKVGPAINVGEVKLRRRVVPDTNGDSANNSDTPPHHSNNNNNQNQMTPLTEAVAPHGTTPSNNSTHSSSLKRLPSTDETATSNGTTAGTESGVSLLRPKPPAKPAKPPKPAPAVTTSASASPRDGASTNGNNGTSSAPTSETNNGRSASPPSLSAPEAFADRMSRFGGAVNKVRRDQVARSMYAGDQQVPLLARPLGAVRPHPATTNEQSTGDASANPSPHNLV